MEGLLLVVRHHLDAEVPDRVGPALDGVGQIPTMEVGIGAVGHQRLLPGHRVHALAGLPVELDQAGLTLGVGQPPGVDAETLHRPVRARNAAVGHVPHGVRLRLGVQRREIPEGVVGALGLRDLSIRLRFRRVDQVRELDGVLDEEHRNVVADQVVIALGRVEPGREAAGVPGQVGGPATAEHGGEPHENGSLRTRLKERRPTDALGGAVGLEDAVGSGAARVHDPLGDAFVIEVADLLAQVMVLQQRRPTPTHPQRVIAVPQPRAVGRGQELALLAHGFRGQSSGRTGRSPRVRTGLVRLGRQRTARDRRLLVRGRLARRNPWYRWLSALLSRHPATPCFGWSEADPVPRLSAPHPGRAVRSRWCRPK